MATVNSASALGYGLLCSYCTVVLPDANGNPVPVTAVQPTFGKGYAPTDPRMTPLPSAAAGRQLLIGALICRLACTNAQMPDYAIPTTLGTYGIDLGDMVFADMTPADVGAFAAAVDAQLRQDERIVQSRTTATLAGDILVVNIALVDGVGPFKLTFTINVLSQDITVLSAG